MSTLTKLQNDEKLRELVFRERLINTISHSAYLICLTLFILFTPLIVGFIMVVTFIIFTTVNYKDSIRRVKSYFDNNYEVKVEKRKK